ncbi:MAG: hypothetical protein WBX22_16955, partial [Silvibacterium sp.]
MRLWNRIDKRTFGRRIVLCGLGLAFAGLVTVRPVHSQSGIDMAAILAGLKAVNNTLTSAVGAPLKVINQIQQQEQQLQQQVLYPLTAINSAKP